MVASWHLQVKICGQLDASLAVDYPLLLLHATILSVHPCLSTHAHTPQHNHQTRSRHIHLSWFTDLHPPLPLSPKGMRSKTNNRD